MTTRKIGYVALGTALYSRLTTHDLTKNYTIYDYVPDNATLPYIVIGEHIGTRSSSLGAADTPGEDNIVIIHIWSKYKGDYEASTMMNNICQAIDGMVLTITGYTPVIAILDYSDITVDNTDETTLVRHGIIRWRFHMA